MLGGVALACAAGRAEAADAPLRLAIPQQPYADALIDLGIQANVSILGTASCGAGGRAGLHGRYHLEQALARLLAGAPCTYRIIDPRTVRIVTLLETPIAPQAEAPRPPSLISEVVVTATKRPATPDSLAASVSTLSGRQLLATHTVDVSQTVGQLAGVLSTNLGPGRDKLLLRGLSDGAFTGRTRSTVSTYLDHAPINYNAPDPDLRLVDIDRVEVIRGPQGALYGSGAVSGIYRIVTRKPDLEREAFGATVGVAATKGGNSSYEAEGYASFPVIPDRLAVRLAAYGDLRGGYLDNANLGRTNVDNTRRRGGRLAVRARFGDNWTLDLLGATQSLKSNDTQYVTSVPVAEAVPLADIGLGAGSAPIQRTNRVPEGHRNTFDYVGATLSGDFDWGSVVSSLSYVHHVFSSQYDASPALGSLFKAGPLDLGVFGETTRANMLVQDLVVRSAGVGPVEWLVGAYGARTVERTPSSLSIVSPGPALSTAYAENRKDRLSEVALYGEGTLKLGGGWSATLGGRFFETRVRTTAVVDVASPYASRGFEGARRSKGFSPKISVQRRFANGDLVYALISEGYRPGGFNSSGFLPIRPTRSTFSPDRLRNYEVGAKVHRLGGRLALRAAAYYDQWSNIQTDQYRDFGLSYTANVGDAEIVGVEAEVDYQPLPSLALQLNGLLSDSRIRHPNPDFTGQVAGALPGVPKSSGGVVAIYHHAIRGDLELRLVGEASYVGPAALSFDANLPPRMDGYVRASLSAELASDRWRLTAYIDNPLNASGDTFAYGNPFSFMQVRQFTPQRPRTVGLRLSVAD